MEAVIALARALGLSTTGQDWGIEHADPARLSEFLAFAQSRIPEHPFELELLAELIFQSAEEAFRLGQISGGIAQDLAFFVRSRHQLFPLHCEYWAQLSKEEWYVPAAIHKALGEA